MAARNLNRKLPLVAIYGPTASGKTSLAISLAKQYDGEIICADSRTVYKGMDIGTAKPSIGEQNGVPHWGLDLVEPGQAFSAADFKRYADEKIAEIRGRGHIPYLVGGTGLYMDAVVFDFKFGGKADTQLRQQLEKMSIEKLQDYCVKNNIELPENDKNKRYLIRAVERSQEPIGGKSEPLSTSIIVGIATDKSVLRKRIGDRTEQIFDDNVVEEATLLGKKYGWESEAMTGNIYPLLRRYLEGEFSLDEVKDKFTTLDWRLAKRQLTWLKRNPYIKWLPLTEAKSYLDRVLANE
ncbi:MAG TPA: tRNA (adenosine(37)-N6)-dimethylallyltransferase MiaA [Candidatus Saccharimonadales bacterium]